MPFDDDLDIASVLVPTKITDAMYTSATANGVALPEDSNPAWSASATYTIGQRVHSPSTHRVYESLKDGNTNHDPTILANRQTATGTGTWWLEDGGTNKWALFDDLPSTQTSGASPLVVTLRPGAFNGYSIYGLDGDSYSVVVKDAPGGNVIYDTGADVPLEGSMPADYYDYFFLPFKPLTQVSDNDIQPYGSAEITLTVKKATGDAKIGLFAVGDLRPLGVPEKNSFVEPKTYSSIGEDIEGRPKIIRRPSAVNLTMQIKVSIEDADSVAQTIQDVLGIPVSFVGSRDALHSKLSAFGVISGRMDYSTYPDRTLNVTMKGFP